MHEHSTDSGAVADTTDNETMIRTSDGAAPTVVQHYERTSRGSWCSWSKHQEAEFVAITSFDSKRFLTDLGDSFVLRAGEGSFTELPQKSGLIGKIKVEILLELWPDLDKSNRIRRCRGYIAEDLLW